MREQAIDHGSETLSAQPDAPAGLRQRGAGLKVLAPEPVAAPAEPRLELDEVRQRLAGQGGRQFWRSLDEVAENAGFQDMIFREFPRQAADWMDDVSRRQFLQLAGGTLALAGLTACTRQPEERLVPYVKKPEEIIPGKPLFFASAATHGGYGTGILVESHMGRPTKVEGNPEHPASLGGSDVFAQAEVLNLYDPDRSTSIHHLRRETTWDSFLQALKDALVAQEALAGAGLRVLTETVTSPSLADQLQKALARFPQARWHQYDAAGRDAVRVGARTAFGEFVETRYDLSTADVILTLEADLLSEGPAHLRYARQFARRRREAVLGGGTASRLYAVESTPSNTGTLADHRLPLKPSEIHRFALAVAAQLGVATGAVAGELPAAAAGVLAAVVEDLRAHASRSLVVAGEYASADLHALAHAINGALGNVGTTVFYSDPVEAQPADQLASLRELAADMTAGKVDLLVILGGNPVFTAPADLAITDALAKVPLRIHHGLYRDETADHCHWHVPAAHCFEGWGDARAFDGTVSIVQPLIEPLYEGRTAQELVAQLSGDLGFSAYELVERYWRGQWGEVDFARRWRRALHDGLVAGSELPPRPVTLQPAGIAAAATRLAAAGGDLELCFRPDPSLFDGRYANNGWLQELPKPLSKLTWDNALILSPATVKRLGLSGQAPGLPLLPDQLEGSAAEAAALIDASGKMVTLTAGGRSLDVPLWVQPGQADGVLTLHLGHGRTHSGRVGTGTGFNVYPLRTSDAPWYVADVRVAATGERYDLSSTQMHHNIPVESEEAKKRHLVRTGSLARYREEPHFVAEMGPEPEFENLSLYPGHAYEGHAWGLAVDLSACLGCNACVVACQSENNIPIVGKQQVAAGREMHWIRIDRYFEGEDLNHPDMHNQPVMCMHCEQAPCEVVCPVAATVHSEEGLNDMVYNRCVGTRYCSNNCPYKVRRFNWFNFNKQEPNVGELVSMARNPDVTVRFRGVMEKCTYCVQRINQAKITAKLEDRKVRDGDIVTACQQACPTEAIVFGDVNDPGSQVSKWKASPLNYGLLTELGNRPRTTYLAKLRNPNEKLEES